MNLFAVIMAGGFGVRLFPVSRKSHPKQFISLGEGGKSLLAMTVERTKPIAPPERQLVIANRAHLDLTRSQVAGIPSENIIGEPVGRNTAPCLGLASLIALSRTRRDDCVIVALPSDHIVKNADTLNKGLIVAAERALRNDSIVTIGIKPDFPNTGYGYIERGRELAEMSGVSVYKAVRFVEKPRKEIAEKYLASGKYLWNAGIFVFRAEILLDEIKRQRPNIYKKLEAIKGGVNDSARLSALLDEHYAGMESISIDYGVMEGAENVEVIPLDCGWSDVGSFAALRELLPNDEKGNGVFGEILLIDCKDSVIYNGDKGRVIACLGLDGVAVVSAGEVTLVVPLKDSQRVKEIVAALEGE
ncbi:MAG: mannose-1-phosphate guanylyltransferase [Myxococcota bacterium]